MPNAPFLAPERDSAFRLGRAKGGGTTMYSLPGVACATVTAVGRLNGTDTYLPHFTNTPLVVDQLAAEVTTATAATNFRMGIYVADTDWQPVGAPLADSGDISLATTGVKTYTPGSPILIPRGRFLTVMNHNDTAETCAWRTFTGHLAGTSIRSTLSTLPYISFQVARAYAAFPTPGTAWTGLYTRSVPSEYQVVLRVTGP